MRGVAKDGVGDVFQMPADLMAAALQGLGFNQGDARCCKTRVGGDGPRVAPQHAPACLRRQQRLARRGLLGVAGQRVVDQAFVRIGPAAHQREVAFAHLALLEHRAEHRCDLGRQREQQHARGAAVQPVHRPHRPAKLVAQQLQRGLVLLRSELGAVHQQPRRFVDGDEVVVEMQDGQRQDSSPST